MQEVDYGELDSLVDEAHARRLQIDAELAEIENKYRNAPLVPRQASAKVTTLDAERKRIDGSLQELVNSQHVPYGYLDHYNQKYMTPKEVAQPAAPEGPGLIDRILKGVKDTAKFAIKEPGSVLRHIEQGKNELVSLPFRAIEGAIGKTDFFRKGLERQQQDVAARDQAAGIDPRSTGPVVAETVGQMAVPVPLPKFLRPQGAGSLLSAETGKNVLKGATVASGYHAAERVANEEPVLDESLGAAAVVGGGLSALLGRLGGKRTVPQAQAQAGPGTSQGPMQGPPPPPSKPPQLTHQPAMVTPPPPGKLDAPIPGARSPFMEREASIKAKALTGEKLTADEKGFLLWSQKNKATPPPNAGGTRDVIGDIPTRDVPVSGLRSTPLQAAPRPAPRPLEQMLAGEKPQPKPMPSMAAASKGIEAEKAARVASGRTPDNVLPSEVKPLTAKQVKAIPPNQIIDVVKQVEKEVDAASKEALLSKVLKGETKVKDIPVKRPKTEALAPAVKGEAGAPLENVKLSASKIAPTSSTATSKLAAQTTPQTAPPASTIGTVAAQKAKPSQASAKPVEPLKTPPAQPSTRLEDYIQQKGYKLETKEPFPGEKSYNVIDPKTGNTIARGDRENILHGLSAREGNSGIKLTSGVDPTDLGKMLKEKLGILPKGVEVTNSPHRERPLNMALRSAGLETPQFAMRKTEAGRRTVDAALDFEDLRQTRVNNLFHAPQKDGTFKDTKLFDYFGAKAADRKPVNDVLVLGDKLGTTFTPEQLARQGLTTDQIRMYEGVREGLDEVKGWVKAMPGMEEFEPKIKGYIPRVWSGDLELFVDGKKYVPTTKTGSELGSSFATLRDAAKEMWKIKADHPTAKIEARFFTDPEFLMSRGIADARAVSKAKANIDALGKLDPGEVESAFKISKGYKDFAKHLMERKDARGYETEDLERVLHSYFHKAAKTVETKRMRDAVHGIMKDHGSELSSMQVKYLESYVDRVAGKPAWDKMALDTFVRETPIGKWIDPVKAGGLIKTARDWITFKSLGFGNVSWAMVNLDSLSRHVWPMLQNEAKGMGNAMAAEKYLGIGVKEFFKNHSLRQKLAHNGVIDIQMMSEHRPQLGPHFGKGQVTPSQVIMYLGTVTEEFVRGTAAIARYRMALDQGLADGEAMRVASRFVAETVGRYSKAGKPPAFTGITGSTLGMFKTYPVVMLQNMFKAFESGDVGVITRYMLAALGVGGAIGALPGSEQVDKLATKTLGKSPIQWAYDNLPEGVLTGVASIAPDPLKMDLSRKAGLPDVIPQDTKDWWGPVVNSYAAAIADLANGEYEEAAYDLMPTSLRNALAVSRKPGYVVGKYDKPSAELKPGQAERIKRGLGFQHPDEVRAYRDYGYLQEMRDYREDELSGLARRIHKGTASPEEKQRYAELGGTNRRLRGQAQRESLTLRQRQERQLPRMLRGLSPETE